MAELKKKQATEANDTNEPTNSTQPSDVLGEGEEEDVIF